LEQLLTALNFPEAYFWAIHSGSELDLFFLAASKRFGVEFKFSEAPKVGKSMHSALKDLDLYHLWIIYPGRHSYPVHEKITVLPLAEIPSLPIHIQQA
jgi:predicted AAA+ superfamily ATPase